ENPIRWKKDMQMLLQLVKVKAQATAAQTTAYLDRMQKYTMKQGLSGEALTCYQDLGNNVTMAQIWNSFDQKFTQGDIPYYTTTLLERIKQKPDEDVSQYATRLKQTIEMANTQMSETQKAIKFVNGLRKPL